MTQYTELITSKCTIYWTNH